MLYIGYNFEDKKFVTTPNYDNALDYEGGVYSASNADVDYLKGYISELEKENLKIVKCNKCGRPVFRLGRRAKLECYDCETEG